MLLKLPATPEAVLQSVIPAALALLPDRLRSDRADVMLLAIGLQESNLGDRRQGSVTRPGPARGLWQFEVSGVNGVMQHPATEQLLRNVCAKRGAPWQNRSIHLQLEQDDLLACAVARLLLWTDAHALPEIGALDDAFDCYRRNWRPGACNTAEGFRECLRRWRGNYPRAVETVTGDRVG